MVSMSRSVILCCHSAVQIKKDITDGASI